MSIDDALAEFDAEIDQLDAQDSASASASTSSTAPAPAPATDTTSPETKKVYINTRQTRERMREGILT